MPLAQRILSTTLGLLLCTLAVFGVQPVQAAKPVSLSITEASWDGATLTIAGKGASGYQIDASNAASPQQALGSDTPGNNGRYTIANSDEASSTVCSVHVEQYVGEVPTGELLIAEAAVTGNAFCDDPPPPNDPPVCVIDSPADDVTILVGDSVSYAGTATDIDGVIQSTDWSFEGGTPSTSTAEDPGPVTYNTAGTYNTIFDATDDDGASCSPVATRTITVNDPGAPEPLPIQTDFKMMMNYELGMHCTGFEFAYCCVLPAYNSILAQVIKPQNGINTPHLLEADPNYNTTADVLGRHTILRDYALDGNGDFKKYVLRYWHDAQPRNDGNGKPQSSTLISNVEGNSLLSWNTVYDAAGIIDPDTGDVTSGCGTGPGDYIRGAMNTGEYDGSTGVLLGDGDMTDNGCTFGVGIDNYQNAVWNHLYIYEVSAAGVEGHKPPGTGTLEAEKYRLGLHVDYPDNFGPAGHNMEGLLTFSGDSGTVVYTQMKVLEDLPVMLTSPRIWEALGLPLTPFEDSIGFFNDPGQVDEDSIRPYVEMKARLHEAVNCVENEDPDTGELTGHFTCDEGSAVLDNQGNEVVGFGTAPIDIPNCERCHSAFDTPNSPNVTGTPEAALVQQEIDFWNAYYNIDTDAGDSDWYSRLKGAAISLLSAHDAEHGTSFTVNYPGDMALRPAFCERGLPDTTACSLHSDCDTTPGAGNGQCDIPQNTRTGHESVICQKCHADNVIAAVKSAYCGPGSDGTGQNCDVNDPRNELFSNIAPGSMLIKPLTEALHWNHRESSECVDPNDPSTCGTITMTDASGRSGGCQGCHPAHRSDGDMAGYPIDLDGNNFYAELDNRDANGGCFVGRDVHSNPAKDIDGAETPSHLNPVGQWLQANVANDGGSWKGVWCTNCHSQAGQQMWKAENVEDLVNAQPGDPGHVREPGVGATLSDVVAAVNTALGTTTSEQTFIEWLDPGSHRATNRNSAIWAPDPGMCNHAASLLGLGESDPAQDGNVATIEIALGSTDGTECSTGIGLPGPSCLGEAGGAPSFFICGSVDGDGDVSVAIQDFCTTPDCVAAAQQGLADGGFTTAAVPVPMSAATDGRDHWLSPGEPHCADCHAAPYVEQSGNINAFPPFNYPRKASLMRYSRGHQDITCQGCHESIHGLYPVTPNIDTTSYAQAASLNHDNSHGPLKCGTCHDVGSDGIPTWMSGMEYNGQPIGNDYDAAVSWMHTYTLEASPLEPGGVCENCHGVKGNNWDVVGEDNKKWVQHTFRNRSSRSAMDKVELEIQGYLSGDLSDPDNVNQIAPEDGVCQQCHRDRTSKLKCDSTRWKDHLLEGRVAESVWEDVSQNHLGSTCGW